MVTFQFSALPKEIAFGAAVFWAISIFLIAIFKSFKNLTARK
jgi:hypothetical protein